MVTDEVLWGSILGSVRFDVFINNLDVGLEVLQIKQVCR